MPSPDLINFRAAVLSDLPLLYMWMENPHVKRWWNDGLDMDGVVRKYTPYVTGEAPIRTFIIQHEATPIGFIQAYRVADWPDYPHQTEESAAALDFFVGEPAFLGHGLGPHVLTRFLRQVIFADPAIVSCYVDPERANERALKTYMRAGFSLVKILDDEIGTHILRAERCG